MKKSTTAARPASAQHTVKQAARSVVTQLRGKRADSAHSTDADIDMSALRAAIDELPELDATKLVSLHRRIHNGDYKINAERIAGKLIALESALD